MHIVTLFRAAQCVKAYWMGAVSRAMRTASLNQNDRFS
jgi:hypothetical protein